MLGGKDRQRLQTFVVIDGRALAVHHGVDFVEAVGTDEAGRGAEVTVDAERVALAVEVRQRQNDGD